MSDLRWHRDVEGYYAHFGGAGFCKYIIYKPAVSGKTLWEAFLIARDTIELGDFVTARAAKIACQSDLESRIKKSKRGLSDD